MIKKYFRLTSASKKRKLSPANVLTVEEKYAKEMAISKENCLENECLNLQKNYDSSRNIRIFFLVPEPWKRVEVMYGEFLDYFLTQAVL